jgi:hypothetical protein
MLGLPSAINPADMTFFEPAASRFPTQPYLRPGVYKFDPPARLVRNRSLKFGF